MDLWRGLAHGVGLGCWLPALNVLGSIELGTVSSSGESSSGESSSGDLYRCIVSIANPDGQSQYFDGCDRCGGGNMLWFSRYSLSSIAIGQKIAVCIINFCI